MLYSYISGEKPHCIQLLILVSYCDTLTIDSPVYSEYSPVQQRDTSTLILLIYFQSDQMFSQSDAVFSDWMFLNLMLRPEMTNFLLQVNHTRY